MIVKFLIVYSILYLSIFFHEIAHFIFAKIFRFKVTEFKMGDDFYAIKIKNFSISLLLSKSYVEFFIPQNVSKIRLIIVYIAGGLANLLLALVFIFLNKVFDYWYFVVSINILLMIFSLIPIKIIKNDMFYLMKIMKSNFSEKN